MHRSERVSLCLFLSLSRYGLQGSVLFRTLGVSNITVTANYLVQQQYFYFNSSLGLSRGPTFFAEWVTSDGRSLSEELIAQYENVGLMAPFQWNPQCESNICSIYAFPFAYIPTGPIVMSQTVGDPTCFSDACVINRGNYVTIHRHIRACLLELHSLFAFCLSH